MPENVEQLFIPTTWLRKPLNKFAELLLSGVKSSKAKDRIRCGADLNL